MVQKTTVFIFLLFFFMIYFVCTAVGLRTIYYNYFKMITNSFQTVEYQKLYSVIIVMLNKYNHFLTRPYNTYKRDS